MHRVQRVPKNSKQRHSSTITVVALGSNVDNSAGFDESDVSVSYFSGTGAGGQHRNRHMNCVRATHAPTGITATGTSSRSASANYAEAMDSLRERVEQLHSENAAQQVNQVRASTIGSSREFTWTQWRDEVKAGGRRRAAMGKALSGRLDPLLSE